MTDKRQRTLQPRLATCLLLWFAMATPLHAQEPQESASEQAGQEQVQDAEPAAEQETAERDRDPFDYRSSEEISEDLSVSFPVDI